MSLFRVLNLISILAALFSLNASAALKISLVTISPGSMIASSFGHTAVVVADTKSPDEVKVYEYGNEIDKIFPAPKETKEAKEEADPSDEMILLQKNMMALLKSKMKAMAVKNPSALSPDGIPVRLIEGYSSAKEHRQIRLDALNLTEDQAEKLVALLEKDVNGGSYNYDNYDNSCATKVRDRLFDDDVLGAKAKEAMLNEKIDISRRQIVLNSIDEAIAQSPDHKVRLWPAINDKSPEIQRSAESILLMAGLKSDFGSSAEFQSEVELVDKALAANAGKDGNPLIQPYAKKFAKPYHDYFFNPRLDDKPISYWEAMFTPKYLRSGLAKVVNVEGDGKPLIVESDAKVLDLAPKKLSSPKKAPSKNKKDRSN